MKIPSDDNSIGLPYRDEDGQLFKQRQKVQEVLRKFNDAEPKHHKLRKQVIRDLFVSTGSRFLIEPPFRCEYGNIRIGENFYANFNCSILDAAEVSIGNDVFLGPNVSLFTSGHPIHFLPRNAGWQFARPITIGDNVWIGGNVVVNPGVKIGSNTVIGSGSVVVSDIPENVVAVGNPCKIIRTITDEDRIKYQE